jgi:hypothetical protein
MARLRMHCVGRVLQLTQQPARYPGLAPQTCTPDPTYSADLRKQLEAKQEERKQKELLVANWMKHTGMEMQNFGGCKSPERTHPVHVPATLNSCASLNSHLLTSHHGR